MSANLHIYDSGGMGRPIVLIHGFPLSHEAFRHQLDDLENAGLRVIAYDRRGFGRSDKPTDGYDYDTLADDLKRVIDQLALQDAILLGFSMGGGEVARFASRHSLEGIAGVIFAAAVPPCLLKSEDNLDGPLDQKTADEKLAAITTDRSAYFDSFVKKFYSVKDEVVVDETELQSAIRLCEQSDQKAAIACMKSFSFTDFRDDLQHITVPALIIHGDCDAIVPVEGSGYRTFKSIPGAKISLITGGPHGINVSHSDEFNELVIQFSESLPSAQIQSHTLKGATHVNR